MINLKNIKELELKYLIGNKIVSEYFDKFNF